MLPSRAYAIAVRCWAFDFSWARAQHINKVQTQLRGLMLCGGLKLLGEIPSPPAVIWWIQRGQHWLPNRMWFVCFDSRQILAQLLRFARSYVRLHPFSQKSIMPTSCSPEWRRTRIETSCIQLGENFRGVAALVWKLRTARQRLDCSIL